MQKYTSSTLLSLFLSLFVFCNTWAAEYTQSIDDVYYVLKIKEHELSNLKKLFKNQNRQYRYQITHLSEKLATKSSKHEVYELEQIQASALRAVTEKFLLARKESESYEKKLSEKEVNYQQLIDTNRDLVAELSEYESKVQSQEVSLANFSSQIKELTRNLNETKNYSSIGAKNLDIKMAELEGENANLRNENELLKSRILELESKAGLIPASRLPASR